MRASVVDRSRCLLDRDLTDIIVRNIAKLGAGTLDRPLHLVAGRKIARQADQRRDLLAARLDAAWRHHGSRIPGQQVHRTKNIVDLGDFRFEGREAHEGMPSIGITTSCAPNSVRWQAARWPPPRGVNTGRSTRQRSKTWGQRLAKGQPGGTFSGLGNSPRAATAVLRRDGSSSGAASSSALE